MATTGRIAEKKQIIEAVAKMMSESGLAGDKASHRKVLSDSLLSTLAMAQMMGFTRNDVIFALKDEWLQMQQIGSQK